MRARLRRGIWTKMSASGLQAYSRALAEKGSLLSG
jgi:hypothetical protein